MAQTSEKVEQPPGDQKLKARQVLIGVAFGFMATFAWAGYNVAAKIGRLDGFTPADLTMLRYAGGAIFFLPFLFRGGNHVRLPLHKTFFLACIIGPGFGMIINTAFGLAPLSHAVVIGPGVAMIVGNLLPVLLDKRVLPAARWVGIGILFIGLLVIGLHRQELTGQQRDHVWLGDIGFACTGVLWSVFGYLLSKWKVSAFTGVGQVTTLSALLFFPFYMMFFDHHETTTLKWISQIAYQGGLGGFLGLAAFALTVDRLGPSPASLFSAFVPSSAILLAIPFMGVVPSQAEVIGVFISTIGLLAAINLSGRPQGAISGVQDK